MITLGDLHVDLSAPGRARCRCRRTEDGGREVGINALDGLRLRLVYRPTLGGGWLPFVLIVIGATVVLAPSAVGALALLAVALVGQLVNRASEPALPGRSVREIPKQVRVSQHSTNLVSGGRHERISSH